uniref:Uncharacterized protein n=1 Tax=Meloidogyne hapla TaxID=6305 RepID=A0A1I8BRA5_MELHA
MKGSILFRGKKRISPSKLFNLIRRATSFQLFLVFNFIQSATYKTATTTDLSQFGRKELGCLYRVPDEHGKTLCFDLILPKDFKALTSTLNEYIWMFRQQTFEVLYFYLNIISYS